MYKRVCSRWNVSFISLSHREIRISYTIVCNVYLCMNNTAIIIIPNVKRIAAMPPTMNLEISDIAHDLRGSFYLQSLINGSMSQIFRGAISLVNGTSRISTNVWYGPPVRLVSLAPLSPISLLSLSLSLSLFLSCTAWASHEDIRSMCLR